jgi:hypothetical protein
LVARAGVWKESKGPLFRSVDKHRKLTLNPVHRNDVLRMIKRRSQEAGLPSFTSPRTTKLYDRTGDQNHAR